ncbi:unnamed protein product [Mucor hiemalis]
MQLYSRPSLGLVFLILTCLQVFGLYIFLKGFLLTRQTFELQGHEYNSWERFPLQDELEQSAKTPPISKPRKPFKRTIFPIIQHLHDTQPRSSLLFQFRADPPTTTMQRIKGIMTGSLPTFIDAGANFASSAVGEDHLLRHIKNKYKNIYFMGDDTWVNLFPETFDNPERTFDSDSFKMLDLDSVDDGIISHLWPLMEGEKDWEVAIAHFLGVDHCGHTYGPSDPNMARKLNQMNGIIERLLPQVDNDTLLVVMGDHGMSVEGDHGGESVEELMSSLFMYSGRPLTLETSADSYYGEFYKRIHDARADRLGYDIASISERLSYDAAKYPVVAQIHLVPTLSYLLGVPIPFGNLGAILPDVIYPEHDQNQIVNLLHTVEQFRINALQVHDYLNQYSQETHQLDFSKDKLDPITQHLYNAEKIMLELTQQANFLQLAEPSTKITEKDFLIYGKQLENAILEYDAFLISTIKYCEAIWAQFDTGCMFIGILLLGCSTITSFWLMRDSPGITYKKATIVGVPVLFMVLLVAYLRYTVFSQFVLNMGWFEKMEHIDWLGTALVFSVFCVSLFMKKYGQQNSQPFWYTCDWYLILIADIAQSFTLGSNSYVIWEDRGTRYTLATLTVCWTLRNLISIQVLSKEKIAQAIAFPSLFLTLVRVTSLTGHCREEQFPDCNYIHNSVLEFEMNIMGLVSVVSLALTYIMILYFSRVFLRSKFIASLYLITSSIVVLRLIQETYLKNALIDKTVPFVALTQKLMDVYLPRVVYGMCLLGTAVSIGHYYFTLQKKKNLPGVGWDILLLWSAVLAIVQRPLASIVILASPLFIYFLTKGSSSSLLLRLTVLHFLGHHLFFVTGHQATFTSLPWKAAFVGFDEMNYYGGMILVTLSTTAGYIVSWIGWFILLAEAAGATDRNAILQPLHLLTSLQSIPTFLCAIFILILRRHLMTWKIFAPRFLLQILLEIGSHFAAIVLEKAL